MTNPEFEDFEAIEVQTEETNIFLRRSGSGPAVLLLHRFPQTHVMWRAVAPLLARRFTVICADLRGYGNSGCPPSNPDHAPYTKRTMANDMVSVMSKLGFANFSVAGHDVLPIVSRSITHSVWSVLLFLTFCRLLMRGTEPTKNWPPVIGRGHCLHSLNLSPNGLCQLLLMLSLTTRSAVGVLPHTLSAQVCGRLISRRYVIPRVSMRSARNIERRQHSITSTMWRIIRPGAESLVPSLCCGAVEDR